MVLMVMTWSDIDLRTDGNGPLFGRLVDRIRFGIETGDLQPGDRLPSERDLAEQLGVSRTTIVNGYRELEAQGLVRGHVGRGTFVCAAHQEARSERQFAWHSKVSLGSRRSIEANLRGIVRNASDRSLISFAAGVTALDCFPAARYAELTQRALCEHPRDALGLAPTEGMPCLREAIARREKLPVERVMIVAGAQQGLDLVTRLLVDPGDSVVMDRPGYVGAIPLFRAAGANIVGWDPESGADELEDLLLRFRPKFLYATPTFSNPSGKTWPVELRRDVVELAERYRLPLIEDEPYRELHFGAAPPPLLSTIADGRGVVQIGTFAKTLSGALRLGWVAGEPSLLDQLSTIKQRSDICSPSLSQMTVAAMIASGTYDAHLARLRPELERRSRAMLGALERQLPVGAIETSAVPGGVFLWGRLGAGMDARELLIEAERLGVTFVPGELFFSDGNGRSHVRLCFSSVPPAVIERGVGRLAEAMRRVAADVAESHGAEPLV